MSKFIRTENLINADIGPNVVSAGYCMVDDDDYAIPLNNQHPYYKLILVPKGTLTLFDENNAQYVLKENDIALIKPRCMPHLQRHPAGIRTATAVRRKH